MLVTRVLCVYQAVNRYKCFIEHGIDSSQIEHTREYESRVFCDRYTTFGRFGEP